MKTKMLEFLLVLFALNSITIATEAEPPSLSVSGPAVEDKVIIHNADKLDVVASGGTTIAPTTGCPPWTAGVLKYEFEYSTLTGIPSSGTASTTTTLKMSRAIEGLGPTKARVSQEWTDSTSPTPLKQTQFSTYSGTKNVKIQKPTTLTFTGSAPGVASCVYSFTIKDQDGGLLKGQPCSLLEYYTGLEMIYYRMDTGAYLTTVTGSGKTSGNSVASSAGTDVSGGIHDNVHVTNVASLEANAVSLGYSYMCTFRVSDHEYDTVEGPDGTKYTTNKIAHSIQTFSFNITLNTAGTTAAAGTSYSCHP